MIALHGAALLWYTASGIVLGASFAGARAGAPRAGVLLAGAGAGTHLLALLWYRARHGELPLAGLGPTLSTLAFLTAVFLFGVASTREGRPLGLVLAPIVVVLLGGALLIGIAPPAEASAFAGLWFALHVTLSLAAYASLTVAFAAGLLYLLQFRSLKGRRFGRIFRYLPPLPVLDLVRRRALVLGFPTLTAGLALGWAWTLRETGSLALADPQVIFGVLTWIVFLALLGGGASGDRRAAGASVAGFLIVVVAYFILRTSMGAGRAFL